MTFSRGSPLSPQVKKIVVSVKHYFDHCYFARNVEQQKIPSTQRTAEAIGIGEASVKRILADFNRDPRLLDQAPQIRGRPSHSVNASHQEQVRHYVREANKKGSYITLEDIRYFLKECGAEETTFHSTTLARTLDRWGFEFGKGKRSQHLKEKDYVIAARQRYLRQKIANRSGRPEVYLDESYVNKNHSNDFIWYSGEDGPWVQKPTGKGEHLIIINAITKKGWVPNAKTVFKSTKKTGDYHGQVNWELFSKWFKDKLIPNIPKRSLIVMDNASYHNTLSEHSAPTASCSKDAIRTWLEHNKIPCREDALKAELVEMLSKLAPEPTYAIDEIAEAHGHTVIRTPPYHPELQPIEMCWGVVKNHVARNSDFTMANLQTQLEEGFKKVTAKTCEKIINKIRKVEDQFWAEDLKLDE